MQFEVYWKNGRCEIIKGNGFADAFTRAGYGQEELNDIAQVRPEYSWATIDTKTIPPRKHLITQGALRALDVWHPGDEVKYEWDGKEWRNKELLEKFSCPA